MTPAVRAFGHAAPDLDVAFAMLAPDEAATALLARCSGHAEAVVQDWTLARRLQALLAVRRAGDAGDRLPARLRCAACGTDFEIEIDLARCEAAPGATEFDAASPDGHAVRLRLPSARDLLAWRAAGPLAAPQIAAALLVAIDGAPPPPGFVPPAAWTDALAAQLAAQDPLTALHVEAPCPDCGATHAADVDLEALLLAEFAACQRRLLDDVAALARAFHWSEAQILALPGWRRAHYLAQVERLEASEAP